MKKVTIKHELPLLCENCESELTFYQNDDLKIWVTPCSCTGF